MGLRFRKNLFILSLYHLLLSMVDSKCPKSFVCGKLGTLGFPFSDDANCGLWLLNDCDSEHPTLRMNASGSLDCYVSNLSANRIKVVVPLLYEPSLAEKSCSSLRNLSTPQSPSISSIFSPSVTLFACSNSTPDDYIERHFQNFCRYECSSPHSPPGPAPTIVYYKNPTSDSPSINATGIPTACSMIQVPRKPDPQVRGCGNLFDLLTNEFELEWNVSQECQQCHHQGGQCLTDVNNEFRCGKGKKNYRIFLIIGGASNAALTPISIIILILLIRRKYTPARLYGLLKAKTDNEKDIELFLKSGNLAPIRYKYSDIKKMTKSFSENLGKGGYGSVYKGILRDGHPVAVKFLNESKGNGEEFMNEVASISRTSHINIVSLLGFCFEGSKRALIYEFMPNGSLEKFIQNTASSSTGGGLGWQKLFEIATGIARGLEYLHQGCNTRILHFDIKPHNILLDKDFNPRISDFGLAKLCPNRSSIVSMLVARGTIGYIAPEVFCRNFGEVSYKSDVYSYGMMVLEIAGGKKNIDPRGADHTSEIYFPHYIYKQLEADAKGDGSFDGIANEDESQDAKRKLIIVGLWCIQTDPNDRPSMTKVVEMLEGKLESLSVPPKPYLSSPQRAVTTFSTSEST